MATQGNGEQFNAKVGGQQMGIRSAYPVVLVLLVCVVPLLTWLIQKERKELVEQFLGTVSTITTQHRDDMQRFRTLTETHHQEQMARQLDVARAMMRVLGWVVHNLELPRDERLPFGAIPPGLEEQLKKQLPEYHHPPP